MKIVLNEDLCQGHAQCEDVAPGIFRVNDDGLLTILVKSPPEGDRALVEEAVRLCPADALRIVED